MDSKNIPPGQKKGKTGKSDIIKRNIEKAKTSRFQSKENNKSEKPAQRPKSEKPVQKPKSENNLKPSKNPMTDSKSLNKLQPKKGKSVENLLQKADSNKNAENLEKTQKMEVSSIEKNPENLETSEIPAIEEKILQVEPASTSESFKALQENSSCKSLKCTPVKQVETKPLPSSYKRRRPSDDEDHFDEKCLKST
jgi:hypothetical protein